MYADIHALQIPDSEELLAELRACPPADGPLFVSPPCVHFAPAIDLDDLAQDVVEGRRRHVPRNVFAPNSFSMKMRRN